MYEPPLAPYVAPPLAVDIRENPEKAKKSKMTKSRQKLKKKTPATTPPSAGVPLRAEVLRFPLYFTVLKIMLYLSNSADIPREGGAPWCGRGGTGIPKPEPSRGSQTNHRGSGGSLTMPRFLAKFGGSARLACEVYRTSLSRRRSPRCSEVQYASTLSRANPNSAPKARQPTEPPWLHV
jgi:hypothetical protein